MTYLLEIFTGIIGGRDRWRTMPWLVILFGVMIVPLGAVSIFFIIIQPILIGTWCTLCLVAAAAMLMQIPYSVDELVATGQFLAERQRKGKSVILAFLRGDTMEGGRQMEPEDFEGRHGLSSKTCSAAASICPGRWFEYSHRRLVDVHPADFRDPRRTSEQRSFDRRPGHYDFGYGFGRIRSSGAFYQYLLAIPLMAAPWMLEGGSLIADWTGVVAGVSDPVEHTPRQDRKPIWKLEPVSGLDQVD